MTGECKIKTEEKKKDNGGLRVKRFSHRPVATYVFFTYIHAYIYTEWNGCHIIIEEHWSLRRTKSVSMENAILVVAGWLLFMNVHCYCPTLLPQLFLFGNRFHTSALCPLCFSASASVADTLSNRK